MPELIIQVGKKKVRVDPANPTHEAELYATGTGVAVRKSDTVYVVIDGERRVELEVPLSLWRQLLLEEIKKEVVEAAPAPQATS